MMSGFLFLASVFYSLLVLGVILALGALTSNQKTYMQRLMKILLVLSGCF